MILQELTRYYERMAARGEATEPGWIMTPIGWCIEISADGHPTAVFPLQDQNSKKPRPMRLAVPSGGSRTSAVKSNLLWDKTAYALGRTEKESTRTHIEHQAFKSANLDLIGESSDPGLIAFRRFLAKWTPDLFDAAPFSPAMLDGNVVFRLAGTREFLHQRAAARALLSLATPPDIGETDTCLITGAQTVPERLHPVIKGVNGSQSSGAYLVSFNQDAFGSYGKEQGANAPVSREAAARYGAALNALLRPGGRNRLARGIGDSTVVFWADASNAEAEDTASAVEDIFASLFGGAADTAEAPEHDDSDAQSAAKVRDVLAAIAAGRATDINPKLSPGVRFHVLGLAPNAARLAVRFWMSDRFDHFAQALLAHMQDLEISPTPRFWTGRKGPPEIWRLMVKTTAVQEKFENVPPQLAGDLARSVLNGTPYPRTWLTTVITRLRAGDPPAGRGEKDIGWHAAAIKACINRNPNEENLPVALDPDYPNEAYQLGRLFAVLEAAQRTALGPNVNATIVDRYYASASSTPARVFPSLLRGARVHLADLKKRNRGGWIEHRLNSIIERLSPELALTLRLEDQGRFAVGYYHERAWRGDTANGSNETDIAPFESN